MASLRLARSEMRVRQSWLVSRPKGWLLVLQKVKAELSFRA